MSFIDGIEHGRPVLFGDGGLVSQACRYPVQGGPTAKMCRLGVHSLKRICARALKARFPLS